VVRCLFSFIFLFLPLSVYAQGSNVFLGYSYLNADSPAGNHSNLNGWNVSLEGKIFPFVGIVADLSGHYGEQDFGTFSANTRQHTFVFGPRVSISVGKIRPFAHYLVGAGHISIDDGGSDTSFTQAVGGGLDYKLIPLIAWRFQGDFLQTRYFGTKQDNFRFSTGIVLHF
jgi:hypothetical protein